MAVNQITQRDVRYGIKHGLDTDGFCEKYGCTNDEFERRIRNLYRHDASVVLDEIHANAKKRNRAGGAKSLLKNAPPPAGSVLSAPDLAQSTIDDIAISSESVALINTKALTTSPKDPSPLQALRTQERQQSDEVISLESEHKSIARHHREYIRQLRQIQEDLIKIKADFETKAAEYQTIVEANNQLVLQMNQISQTHSEKVALLEETRRSIESLTTIVICAYENGTIEPLEKTSGFELDESGSDARYTDLLSRAECEDLRLKDIRILSRMLSIVHNTTRRVEPVFENTSLEPFFQTLQAI